MLVFVGSLHIEAKFAILFLDLSGDNLRCTIQVGMLFRKNHRAFARRMVGEDQGFAVERGVELRFQPVAGFAGFCL